ncbi:helix-turn-helix domain-containing protein [Gordonia sp. NB41Y]|uniref:helix-turn-helix domain-containing protein n=1 Tax=Gordonia sp. NB41Y TaxID=875808 RepID=UPI0002BF4B06|nr:helix-turn-helix domain-containing protein [Gordonia sp. NB41Y]EMP13106.1 AraC family transcriptional regulator [Gordonia sp. NB41Y]WLP90669.1 helix-turn-helix domain-containing protein [Gordonia sp. NB41Y]
MTEKGADRLRELLDAVLGEDGTELAGMAADAHASSFHFSRQVSRSTGEAPVALRRRVTLERAAWYLLRGRSVTDVAFDSGYDSVEGFSRAFTRAFGHPPSTMAAASERGHWLPAPNGIHFHSPTVLYVDAGETVEETAGDVVTMMVRHDLDDVTALLEAAAAVPETEYRRVRLPRNQITAWQEPDESIAQVLHHLVTDKLPWLASIEGGDHPDLGSDDLDALTLMHPTVAGRWLALVRDIERRQAWSDRVIDALCEPPESFLLSQIVTHVLTFAAHRRLLLRMLLREAGVDVLAPALDPDPIIWHRNRSGGF